MLLKFLKIELLILFDRTPTTVLQQWIVMQILRLEGKVL